MEPEDTTTDQIASQIANLFLKEPDEGRVQPDKNDRQALRLTKERTKQLEARVLNIKKLRTFEQRVIILLPTEQAERAKWALKKIKPEVFNAVLEHPLVPIDLKSEYNCLRRELQKEAAKGRKERYERFCALREARNTREARLRQYELKLRSLRRKSAIMKNQRLVKKEQQEQRAALKGLREQEREYVTGQQARKRGRRQAKSKKRIQTQAQSNQDVTMT